MNQKIEAACISHVGKIRTNNEDNLYFNGVMMPLLHDGIEEQTQTSFPSIFAVFDGMGGESNGEKASFLATQQLKEEIENNFIKQPELFLNEACSNMNKVICEQQERSLMGTTAAILYFQNQKAYVCNLGDSRIYLFRKQELVQISEDHVMKMATSNGFVKPPLTQNLGIPEEDMKIEPYIKEFECENEDKFLICSDGLTDMVSEEEIGNILKQSNTPSILVEDLLQKALENGGKDNVTMVICEIHI